VSTVGPDRVLFGTGYPETEPMAAVTQLMYADITESDRAAIGAGNLHRLLGGVLT
jgi:predicted TIM-barrel fold metal-dependent hydrolase